mmetsp:Transcript_4200/g.14044  ORF Transcript_4200/g.14044 Transcript_4200/m.14044 type:complete len:275 (+) Transcript_4200:261-1085(+)
MRTRRRHCGSAWPSPARVRSSPWMTSWARRPKHCRERGPGPLPARGSGRMPGPRPARRWVPLSRTRPGPRALRAATRTRRRCPCPWQTPRATCPTRASAGRPRPSAPTRPSCSPAPRRRPTATPALWASCLATCASTCASTRWRASSSCGRLTRRIRVPSSRTTWAWARRCRPSPSSSPPLAIRRWPGARAPTRRHPRPGLGAQTWSPPGWRSSLRRRRCCTTGGGRWRRGAASAWRSPTAHTSRRPSRTRRTAVWTCSCAPSTSCGRRRTWNR